MTDLDQLLASHVPPCLAQQMRWPSDIEYAAAAREAAHGAAEDDDEEDGERFDGRDPNDQESWR